MLSALTPLQQPELVEYQPHRTQRSATLSSSSPPAAAAAPAVRSAGAQR